MGQAVKTDTSIQIGLVAFVLFFLAYYVLIYAFKPKRVQAKGPDKRPTGSVCMRRAVLTATGLAILSTVIVIAIYYATKTKQTQQKS